MVRRYIDFLFQEHRDAVHAKKIPGLQWNLNVDEFQEIFENGCYFCGKTYINADDTTHSYRINRKGNYTKDNTITLCKICHKFVKKNDIESLVKMILHIGTRINTRKYKIPHTYLDAFINNTSRPSIDNFIEEMKDQDFQAIDKITDEYYEEVTTKACYYCERPDAPHSRNLAIILRDTEDSSFVTLCRNCNVLYKCFEIYPNFETHMNLCCDHLIDTVPKLCKNTIRVKNSCLYLNHSDKQSILDNNSYTESNVRFDNLENGLWKVRFGDPTSDIDNNKPFLDIRHELYQVNHRYNKENVLMTRNNQLIDSFLVSPYELDCKVQYEESYYSLLTDEDDIIELVELGKFPGQVSFDSKVQIGLPCLNTKMKVVLDYDTNSGNNIVKRVRFYSNSKSITICECNTNKCDECIENQMKRESMIYKNLPLRIALINKADGTVSLRSDFVKHIRHNNEVELNDEEIKMLKGETEEDYAKRIKIIKEEKRKKILCQLIGDYEYKKEKNEYQKALRRSKGVKERVKGRQDPNIYMESHTNAQVEKYGEEKYHKITSLKQRIYRARKKKDFSEEKLKEMEKEWEQLAL